MNGAMLVIWLHFYKS